MQPSELDELISRRRAVFPKSYIIGREIPQEIIEQMLENANYAPTHRLTEPWRFRIFRWDARQRLADFLTDDYRNSTPLAEQSDMKIQKMADNPLRSACVVAICLKAHADLLPEWEEIAAVSMAVQNMWLTCTAHDIGSYWSSPSAITVRGRAFLELDADERCLGLFYMGYHTMPEVAPQRRPIEEKVFWINA